jgi:hypothetical protein
MLESSIKNKFFFENHEDNHHERHHLNDIFRIKDLKNV